MSTISGLVPVSFESLNTRSTAGPSHYQKGQGYVSSLIDLAPHVDHDHLQFEEIRAARDGRHLVLTYPNISTSRASPAVHDTL